MSNLSSNTKRSGSSHNSLTATQAHTTPSMESMRPPPKRDHDRPAGAEPSTRPVSGGGRGVSEPFSCAHCGGERYYLVLHAEALTNKGGLRLTCSTCQTSHALYDNHH